MPDSSPPVHRGATAPVSVRGAGPLELLVFKDDGMAVYLLPESGTVSIGRSADNDVCVEHGSVSRRHAVLHVVGPTLQLEDLASANGTFFYDHGRRVEESALIDDRTLPSPGGEMFSEPVRIMGRPADVRVGAHLLLGSLLVSIRRVVPHSDAPAEGSPTISRPGTEGHVVLVSPEMIAVHEQARLAAESGAGVLLLGESGVGKEVLARAIHGSSPRAGQPFRALNCTGLAESQLEAELFGHEKGPASGAPSARAGLLEAADGGTVFLDEIGELPMSLQIKLLRLIEERTLLREGGNAPRDLDVRFLFATSRDLENEVARGNFRKDLFLHASATTLRIPPLRERKGEIGPLARAFLRRASAELDRTFVPVLSDPALALLQRYSWPGNVRELRNMIVRAVVLCPGNAIGAEHLPPRLSRWAPTPAQPMPVTPRQKTPSQPGLEPVVQPASSRVTFRSLSAAAAAASAPPSPSPSAAAASAGDGMDRQRVTTMIAACAGDQILAAVKLGITRRRLLELLEEPDLPPRGRR